MPPPPGLAPLARFPLRQSLPACSNRSIMIPRTSTLPTPPFPTTPAPHSRLPSSCRYYALKPAYKSGRQLSEKEKLMRRKERVKMKAKRDFEAPPLDNYPKYSLCDALRILRAAEVGRPPSAVKYSLFVRMRTQRSGPVVRSRIQLPFPVQTEDRIGVICPEGSTIAADAMAAGAVIAGQETLFEKIRAGQMPFTKLICHVDSEAALNKANLGRILGPKGLMPNKKTRTITRSVKALITDMVGSLDYRERSGVVRMVIGGFNFTPKMVSENIKAFMREVKASARKINFKNLKELHEVVLSSSHGPGITLNGLFNSTDKDVTPEHLSTPM